MNGDRFDNGVVCTRKTQRKNFSILSISLSCKHTLRKHLHQFDNTCVANIHNATKYRNTLQIQIHVLSNWWSFAGVFSISMCFLQLQLSLPPYTILIVPLFHNLREKHWTIQVWKSYISENHQGFVIELYLSRFFLSSAPVSHFGSLFFLHSKPFLLHQCSSS